MAEIKLTKDNFEAEVLHSDTPVLVDFWATWCGPCKLLAPFVAELAEEYEGKLKVGKVNVDEEPVLSMEYRIVSIPSLYLFVGGKVVRRTVGYMSMEELEDFIKLC